MCVCDCVCVCVCVRLCVCVCEFVCVWGLVPSAVSPAGGGVARGGVPSAPCEPSDWR